MFSALSGVSGLVSGALGTLASSGGDIANNILSNYYARKASSKEFQRSVELWNMQNEYNTPTNQMKRLREAGLNPNLAYGNLSSSAAGSIHVPAREDFRSPFQNLDLVGKYQDLRQRDAQIQNIKAQTDFIKQQSRALGMENKENAGKGTSRATPVIERNFRGLLRIGEDIGNRLASYVIKNDFGKRASNMADVYRNSVKSGFKHAVPFYGAYDTLNGYFNSYFK